MEHDFDITYRTKFREVEFSVVCYDYKLPENKMNQLLNRECKRVLRNLIKTNFRGYSRAGIELSEPYSLGISIRVKVGKPSPPTDDNFTQEMLETTLPKILKLLRTEGVKAERDSFIKAYGGFF